MSLKHLTNLMRDTEEPEDEDIAAEMFLAALEQDIDERIREYMATNPILQPLETAIAALQAEDVSLQTQVTEMVTALGTLGISVTGELTAVGKALADLLTYMQSGGTVTPAQVQALAMAVAQVTTDTTNAVAALQSAASGVATDQASLDAETTTATGQDPGESPSTNAPAATAADAEPKTPTPSVPENPTPDS